MKKIRLLLAIALFMFFLNGVWGQNSQYDVYDNIPNFKSISFIFSDSDVEVGYKLWNESGPMRQKHNDGNKLSMAIYDDYSVRLQYTSIMSFCEGKGVIPFSITGSGMIQWQNDRMMLDMDVRVSSSGGVDNICSEYVRDVYSFDSYSFPNYGRSFRYTYVLTYDDRGFFVLSGNDISSTIEGTDDYFADNGGSRNGIPVLYKTLIKLTGKALRYSPVAKSQSEINKENSDMYGKWQWNDDRSVIYLESTTRDAYLVIWNNDGNLSWGFQLSNAATGYKTDMTESGEELASMMLSFDGSSEQSFSFTKIGSSGRMTKFLYVQYDRFMGTLKTDTSILSQIKDKRILILNYKQNGSAKIARFQLEGLEAIYNAITQ